MRRRCSRADASWSADRAADAEIHWPSAGCGPHVGQVWAVEVELTPKPAARIMAGLLARPGYTQVVYLTSPAARAVVTATAGNLPESQRDRPRTYKLANCCDSCTQFPSRRTDAAHPRREDPPGYAAPYGFRGRKLPWGIGTSH